MLYSEYKDKKYQDKRLAQITANLEELDRFLDSTYARSISEESIKHIRDHINTIGPVDIMTVRDPDDFIGIVDTLQYLGIVSGNQASVTKNKIYRVDFDLDEVCIVSGSPMQKIVNGQWPTNLLNKLVIYTPVSKGAYR